MSTVPYVNGHCADHLVGRSVVRLWCYGYYSPATQGRVMRIGASRETAGTLPGLPFIYQRALFARTTRCASVRRPWHGSSITPLTDSTRSSQTVGGSRSIPSLLSRLGLSRRR